MTYPPYNGKKNIILESFFVWGLCPTFPLLSLHSWWNPYSNRIYVVF